MKQPNLKLLIFAMILVIPTLQFCAAEDNNVAMVPVLAQTFGVNHADATIPPFSPLAQNLTIPDDHEQSPHTPEAEMSADIQSTGIHTLHILQQLAQGLHGDEWSQKVTLAQKLDHLATTCAHLQSCINPASSILPANPRENDAEVEAPTPDFMTNFLNGLTFAIGGMDRELGGRSWQKKTPEEQCEQIRAFCNNMSKIVHSAQSRLPQQKKLPLVLSSQAQPTANRQAVIAMQCANRQQTLQ